MPVSPPAAGQVVRSSNNRSISPLRSHSGRLSGLLSGCPPTNTRPQARAKLGGHASSRCPATMQENSLPEGQFLSPCPGRGVARPRTGKDVQSASPDAHASGAPLIRDDPEDTRHRPTPSRQLERNLVGGALGRHPGRRRRNKGRRIFPLPRGRGAATAAAQAWPSDSASH